MEEKTYRVDLLLVFENIDNITWSLNKYININLETCFERVIGSANIGGINYSKEDIAELLENKTLFKSKTDQSLINCSNDQICVYCVYISKVITEGERQKLNRKLHSNISYTYEEIQNTFVNPYIEKANNMQVKPNIFITFQETDKSGIYTLLEYYEVDLIACMNTSSIDDDTQVLCLGKFFDKSFVQQILRFKPIPTRHMDENNRHIIGAYIDKEMSEKRKKEIIDILTIARLKKQYYSWDEIEKLCINFCNKDVELYKLQVDNNKNNEQQNHSEIKVSCLTEGVILNNREYITDPAVGREAEIENLIVSLAQSKKCPILVGESGVGKTAIVDQLVYMIQNNKVPSFLKNKVIVEINPNSLVAGTQYRGSLEEKLERLFKTCEENNLILFIDNMHLMYAKSSNEANMADIMKQHIDRYGLKVIGTIADKEYDIYFSDDCFNRIDVKVPAKSTLNIIAKQSFDNLSIAYNIACTDLFSEYPNIIEDLITLTSPLYRTYDDKANNPDLVIEIIDKAFAYVIFEDGKNLQLKHVLRSIEACERIDSSARERIINEILEFKMKQIYIEKLFGKHICI